MSSIESAGANLKDMPEIYLAGEVNMFSGCEVGGKKKMSVGLIAIGKLHVNEECLEELDGTWRIGTPIICK